MAGAEPVLKVRDLRAYYQMRYFGITREVRAVDDITLDINRNEIYGLAGESSSGKTSFIKTIAAANRPPLNVVGGSVRYSFLDRDIHALDDAALTAVRWRHISYIMQGSMNVLNPVRRVRHTFVDFAFRHIGRPMPEFLERVEAHLDRLHLRPGVLDAYPHELSGGMRQRVAIALATICRPEFVIADEPTTALDVVVQKDVLALMREIQREIGSSMLFVTHDMSVHANMTDRLGIMYAGRLVEEAPTPRAVRAAAASLQPAPDPQPAADRRPGVALGPYRFAAEPGAAAARLPLPSALPARHGRLPPRAPGADGARGRAPRRLLRGQPGGEAGGARARAGGGMSDLLSVEAVTRTYAMGGLFGREEFDAVSDVGFALPDGKPEIFTIVGESGSGKSTLARMILGLVPPTRGRIMLRGRDISGIRGGRDRKAFMARVQPIFQNPFEAFNPLKRVDRYLLSTARHFSGARRGAPAQAAADAALRKVGLSFEEVTRRFPHELSGGQLQRVAIARALIPEPSLLVADEPVSMVDASLAHVDRQPLQDAARRPRGLDHLHHPRPRHGLLHQRPHHRHGEGRGRRGRRCPRGAGRSAARLYPPPQGLGPVGRAARRNPGPGWPGRGALRPHLTPLNAHSRDRHASCDADR